MKISLGWIERVVKSPFKFILEVVVKEIQDLKYEVGREDVYTLDPHRSPDDPLLDTAKTYRFRRPLRLLIFWPLVGSSIRGSGFSFMEILGQNAWFNIGQNIIHVDRRIFEQGPESIDADLTSVNYVRVSELPGRLLEMVLGVSLIEFMATTAFGVNVPIKMLVLARGEEFIEVEGERPIRGSRAIRARLNYAVRIAQVTHGAQRSVRM